MKRVETSAGVEVTIYIDRLFEHRLFTAGENNTLHVMDTKDRVAILRVGAPLNGDKGPRVQYHLGDHLGSAALVVGGADASAKGIQNREEFFPYGETSFGSFSRKKYRYIGRERDEESGLNYHGARFYAAHLARWAGCDPSGRIDATNLFVAMRANPFKYLDWDGLNSDVNGTPSPPQSLPPADAPVQSEVAGFTNEPNDKKTDANNPRVRAKVAFPNSNTVVRRTNGRGKIVDNYPETLGFKATDPSANIRPSTHALNEHGGKSQLIAVSELEFGAPNIEGDRYWIDLDKTSEAGGRYISPSEVAADFDARVAEGTLHPERAGTYKAANEKEGFLEGKVPGRAVESSTTRGLKAAGGFLFVYGVYNTTENMCAAIRESGRTQSARPVLEQGARETGGWAGAVLGAESGAAIGASFGIETGPGAVLTALLGSILGGSLGYAGVDLALDAHSSEEKEFQSRVMSAAMGF